jgi:hypothetical protein
MASPISVRVNHREFDATIKRYSEFSRRDLSVIVNTKAFYIARRAVIETPKADKQQVAAELRGQRTKNVTSKRGKVRAVNYTLAQLIVMARRALKGESTAKKDIKADVKSFIASRLRSIAFLKSGWLPAIKRLEPLAEKIGGGGGPRPTKSNTGTQYGRAKGAATPAVAGFKPKASILNDALPRPHGRGLLGKIISRIHNPDRAKALAKVQPALQKAFDAETQSMKDYIAKKLKKSAQQSGIKTQ